MQGLPKRQSNATHEVDYRNNDVFDNLAFFPRKMPSSSMFVHHGLTLYLVALIQWFLIASAIPSHWRLASDVPVLLQHQYHDHPTFTVSRDSYHERSSLYSGQYTSRIMFPFLVFYSKSREEQWSITNGVTIDQCTIRPFKTIIMCDLLNGMLSVVLWACGIIHADCKSARTLTLIPGYHFPRSSCPPEMGYDDSDKDPIRTSSLVGMCFFKHHSFFHSFLPSSVMTSSTAETSQKFTFRDVLVTVATSGECLWGSSNSCRP